MGCAGASVMTLPAPESPEPIPRNRGLLVGFGRADITPPPGFALAGNGPQSSQAAGYRHRLFARAMVMEDADGERIAILAADLGLMSLVLHRLTASRLKSNNVDIGADRLLLAVTHTHSGPGNVFGASQYNEQSGSLPGYDEHMVEFLVTRFAAAVDTAFNNMRPSKAAWGTIGVVGMTENRSFPAFLADQAPTIDLTGAGSLQDSLFFSVDTTLTMLRVDQCTDDTRRHCAPTGALSMFAVHGTGNPMTADLIDGDVHGIVERAVEEHIDRLNGAPHPGYRSSAFHLFANGAEGDVRPSIRQETRCERFAEFRAGFGPGGARRPPAPEEWHTPMKKTQECLRLAKKEVARIGQGISRRAIRLFDQIGTQIQGTLKIERVFASLPIREMSTRFPVCPEPLAGVASAGGSYEDAHTAMYGWKVFGLIDTGIGEGGKAARGEDKGCHGKKRILLGGLQRMVTNEYSLPHVGQLALVQLGSTLIAALPAEITTVAGLRMKTALLDEQLPGIERTAIMGLTNGYMQYLTTSEEYSKQHYEGGSTLYGPNTAAAFTDRFGMLADSLVSSGGGVDLETINVVPGRRRSYFRRSDRGPGLDRIDRIVETQECNDDVLSVSWIDAHPGRLLPADGLLLEIQSTSSSGNWTRIAWDDRYDVEVRAERSFGGRGYLWNVRYESASPLVGKTLRVEFYSRTDRSGSVGAFTSQPISCS
jgi:neutral ceramidase